MMSAVRCASHIKCLRRGRHQASRAATTNGNLNALVRDENWRLCFAQFSAIGLEILHSGVADDGDDRRVWTKLFREPQGRNDVRAGGGPGEEAFFASSRRAMAMAS